MRNVSFAIALVIACAGASTVLAQAPLADHHLHVLSPAAAAHNSETPLPAAQVPDEIDRLLREREKAWRDAVALGRLYTEDSLVLDPDDAAWLRGAAGPRYLSGVFARDHQLMPVDVSIDGSTARLAVYYTRPDGNRTRYFAHGVLALKKQSDGAWRIALEAPVWKGPWTREQLTAAELVAQLDDAGIARGAVLSVAYWFRGDYEKVKAENDWMAAEVAKYPQRLVGFCGVDPLRDYAPAEIARCAKNPLLRGVKMQFGNSRVDLRNPEHVDKVRRVFRAANDSRMAVVAHLWTDRTYGRAEAEVFLERILGEAPDVPVQIAHFAGGGPGYTDEALEVFANAIAANDARTKNLYFDLATVADSQSAEALNKLAMRIRQIGVQRVLYGTDTSPPNAPPRRGWANFRTSVPLTDEEMKAIASNAAPYFAIPAPVAATPVSSDPWSLLAQRDLAAMREQILANHPGPADPLNRDFRTWLDDGFAASVAKAREATTFGGYVYALRHYGAGFRDGHLNYSATVERPRFAWPGFLVELRGGKYVVGAAENDASLPPAGSELLDCDGRAPRQIAEQDVWPYTMGPMIESRWPVVASALLLDRGNPWAPRAKECRFRIGDTVETRALRYRNTTHDTVDKLARVTGAAEGSVRKSGANGVWVTIPTFTASTDAIIATLEQQIALAPEWRSADFIVFDVRGNGGGNSSWGKQLLDALYGKEYLERTTRTRFAGQYVDWRVSKDNVAHIRAIVAQIRREQGDDAPSLPYFSRIADGMKEALARNEPLFRLPGGDDRPASTTSVPAPLYRGKVILLTDTACASACLDFADEVRPLPNATHVGLSTSADSVYMEIRGVGLPSGIGWLNLPVKVYRDRPRGHNEPYVPHVPYAGDIRDTAAVEKWILAITSAP